MITLYETKWTDALKAAYAKEHPENCAGPDGSFPIKDSSDVGDAWDLAGHAANPDAVRAKVKAIAKRLDLTAELPDTAKEQSAALARPKKKIGTLPICWLEYNGRSLNGRLYPKDTCDTIFKATQAKLAPPHNFPHPTTTLI